MIQWIAKKLEWQEISKQQKTDMIGNSNFAFKNLEMRRIKSIMEDDIEDFLKCAIKDHELTQKSFSNLRTLVLERV